MSSLHCDVLVIGCGISGLAAATSAARSGSKTIVIDSKTFVGGIPSTGYCLHSFITKKGCQVVFGLAQEIVNRMTEMGGAVGHVPYHGFFHSVTPIDGETFRILSTNLLDEAGVEVLLGVMLIEASSQKGNINNVKVATKDGIIDIQAKTYIDASGDGDLAVMAGAKYEKGDKKTGKMQPISTIIRCYATDNKKIAELLSVTKPAMAKRADYPDPIPVYFNGNFGRWNDVILEKGIFPNANHKVFFNTVWPNHINVNTVAAFGLDGTNSFDLSRATNELTKKVYKATKFLKEYVPGFENAYFAPASWAQVRETRRIEGLYTITDDDAIRGRKFDDTIGQICFPVDIHDPDTGQATFYDIGDDGAFDVPFRALVAKGLNNLLVAGRCISATHYAHGATRNHAPCLVTGEAAGVAASIAVKSNSTVPELDVKKLQNTLLEQGVFLGDKFKK